MIFKHRDGEFRIYDKGGTTIQPVYMELLFTGADLSFPLGRAKVEEMLNMDRGNFDSNASYSKGVDDPIMEPLSLSISAKLDDTTNTTYLKNWLSGVSGSRVNDLMIYNCKGTSSVSNGVGASVVTPAFADSTKAAYHCEVLWDSLAGTDLGWKLSEVYFPPDQQSISEAEDSVTISLNGLIYGAVKNISSFTSGVSIQRTTVSRL